MSRRRLVIGVRSADFVWRASEVRFAEAFPRALPQVVTEL